VVAEARQPRLAVERYVAHRDQREIECFIGEIEFVGADGESIRRRWIACDVEHVIGFGNRVACVLARREDVPVGQE
jgi:hypothetical protein